MSSSDSTEIQQLLQEDDLTLRSFEHELTGLQKDVGQCEAKAEEIKTEIVDLLTQEAQVQNALAYDISDIQKTILLKANINECRSDTRNNG